MKLRDIMSKNIEAIDLEATLLEAANKMARLDIGFLPVMSDGQGDEIAGAITDRDLVVRAMAEGLDPKKTKVGEIMTIGVATLTPDDDAQTAAELMEQKRIRRIAVKDSSGKYLGVVTLGDLALRTDDNRLPGSALGKVCEPNEV